MSSRIEAISARLLGRPYRVNPLIGSAEVPEEFVHEVNAFDCVTYVETVLAQAGTRNTQQFVGRLKRLRYRSGRVSWRSRNHYMTQWIVNNVKEGFIRPVSLASQLSVKERVLDVVPGLPPLRRRFKCLPKRRVSTAVPKINSGDIIFFASTRSHLDVFHCGIVIKTGEGLLLRHASRREGRVVEQELKTFLKSNRMAGIIVVRPREQG